MLACMKKILFGYFLSKKRGDIKKIPIFVSKAFFLMTIIRSR